MISLVICLILAAVAGFIAIATSREKKTHSVAVVMFFLSICLVIVGVVSYPVCEQWWSQYQIDIEANRVQVEVNRANKMINALGGVDNYLKYLDKQQD